MALAERLREVRVGVIARTSTPDPQQANSDAGVIYTPPALDGFNLITNLPTAVVAGLDGGSTPTVADLAPIADSYPRRTFQARLVPRNALGYLP